MRGPGECQRHRDRQTAWPASSDDFPRSSRHGSCGDRRPVFPPSVLPPGIPGKLDAIYFDFDKYNIKPEFKDVMQKNADWLKANKDYNIRIEGNCDERGTTEYNMALGDRRANAAAKFLMNLGVGKEPDQHGELRRREAHLHGAQRRVLVQEQKGRLCRRETVRRLSMTGTRRRRMRRPRRKV